MLTLGLEGLPMAGVIAISVSGGVLVVAIAGAIYYKKRSSRFVIGYDF